MENIFIEARYSTCSELKKSEIEALIEPVAVCGTVQYLDCALKIKKQIESFGKKAVLPKLMHAKYKGQVLGCSIGKIFGVKSILYIGDGMFHLIALQIKNSCEIYSFNPKSRIFSKLDPDASKKHLRRVKGAVVRFLSSKTIGILLSIKPGQNRKTDAEQLYKKLRSKGVGAYMFIFDTLNPTDLANFPFIECFVNTACPRIFYDEYETLPRPVVNLDDVKDL